MSATKPGIYEAINVHDKEPGPLWPEHIPELTEVEAIRAARRLWRFSCGTTFSGVVKVTSGNRYNRIAWERSVRCIYVNPERGWRDFVHELSHAFDYVVNGESSHNKHHHRFEVKLVKEVVRRGYLDGKLRDPVESTNVVPIVDQKMLERRKRLDAIEMRMINWQRKQQRAERAIAKLNRQKRGLERHIS